MKLRLAPRDWKNIVRDFKFKDQTYPNGEKYQQVSLVGLHLGHLVESDAGFLSPGWKKSVATKNAALEKLRTAAIADRKRQITVLSAEIEKLAAA